MSAVRQPIYGRAGGIWGQACKVAKTYTLIGLMALVLFLTTVELAWIILQDIISPPLFLLDMNELVDIFGLFRLILIMVELIDTVRKMGAIVSSETCSGHRS